MAIRLLPFTAAMCSSVLPVICARMTASLVWVRAAQAGSRAASHHRVCRLAGERRVLGEHFLELFFPAVFHLPHQSPHLRARSCSHCRAAACCPTVLPSARYSKAHLASWPIRFKQKLCLPREANLVLTIGICCLLASVSRGRLIFFLELSILLLECQLPVGVRQLHVSQCRKTNQSYNNVA